MRVGNSKKGKEDWIPEDGKIQPHSGSREKSNQIQIKQNHRKSKSRRLAAQKSRLEGVGEPTGRLHCGKMLAQCWTS